MAIQIALFVISTILNYVVGAALFAPDIDAAAWYKDWHPLIIALLSFLLQSILTYLSIHFFDSKPFGYIARACNRIDAGLDAVAFLIIGVYVLGRADGIRELIDFMREGLNQFFEQLGESLNLESVIMILVIIGLTWFLRNVSMAATILPKYEKVNENGKNNKQNNQNNNNNQAQNNNNNDQQNNQRRR